MAKAQDINEEFLLQCVANYKPLYDKTDKGYKSLLQKENCWSNVATSLHTTVPIVKTRFKALREKYRRELAIEERLTRSGAPANTRPVWSLMSFFKFLYREENARETSSNIETDEQTSQQSLLTATDEFDSEILDDPITEILLQDHQYTNVSQESSEHGYEFEPQPSTSRSTPDTNTPTLKKRKTVKDSENVDNVLLEISSAIKSITQKKTVNKYDLFAQYLASELKEMDKNNADVLMENINLQVITYKKKLRQ